MAEKLTPQQKMAVENRGGKLLVSAAAGSGKTKVLVDRLLSYIFDPNDPANLDDFLIITYTKAAAAELRGKIASKLTEHIAANPENRHLQQQMQRLYLAKISTVHSFCSDILREYAHFADISVDFRVAEENECLELQMLVLERILNEAYASAEDNPDFRAFVDTQGFGRDDRAIPQIVLKVYNSARCHLDPEKWLSWCVECTDSDVLSDVGQTVWGQYLIDDLFAHIDLHLEAMRKCRDLASGATAMEKPAALLANTVAQLEQLRNCRSWDEIVTKKQIDYGSLRFSKKCTDLELIDRIKAIREACKDGLNKKLRVFSNFSEQVLLDLSTSGAAARGLVALVRKFSAGYDQLKRAHRILDFGDLEHKMLDLLMGKRRNAPTALSREIGSRFREIMVDEYQDSNSVQDAIFNALTAVRNNCFMVGDVKQSIYQFRLADPGIFISKYNAYAPAEYANEGEGRKVLLSSNFRSGGAVISAVNDVFSTCMSERVGGLVYGEAERLYEGLNHQPLNEPEIELYAISVQEDTYSEEAAFVANRICTLLDGTHMIRDGENLRPIVADDIVILLRSPGSVGGDFVYALERKGIRCVTGSGYDLLQTEEISALRSLLQIISNPLQDIPLTAVLTSRVFAFDADDLAQIRINDRRSCLYDAMKSVESARMTDFLAMLASLRKHARFLPLSQLLQKILLVTHFDSIYSALPNGAERVLNIQRFCQLAADYEALGQRDMHQFLEHLKALEIKGLTHASDQKVAGAVTIMSIHKSKGLEFPVVFLSGLSRGFNKESLRAQVMCDKELGLGLSCVDREKRVRYPSIAKRAIAAKMMADSLSEEMRVLYVAMTRPKDRIIMTYAVDSPEKDISNIALRMEYSPRELLTLDVNCPGEWILQTAMRRTEAGQLFALGGYPGCTGSFDTAWHIRVVETVEDREAVKLETVGEETISPAFLKRIEDNLAFRYPHLDATTAPSKQTATQLKGRQKDREASEHTTVKRESFRAFRQPGFAQDMRNGKEYGNAIHAIMQHIRYEACVDTDGVTAEFKRLTNERFISAEQAELVAPEMIVKLFSTEFGKKLIQATDVLREFKFSILDDGARYVSGMKGEQVLLQGVVDCALIEQDGITVVDFKSDYVTEETLPEVVDKYRTQVSVYVHALERIYCRKVKSSMLYFFRLGRFVDISA